MTRYTVALRLRPLTWLDRIWYRRIRETPPLSSSRMTGRVARLVPYRLRRFHHAYATSRGFFWLPCPLCDRPFGGHEWGKSIPDPMQANGYIGICLPCSRARDLTEATET